MIPVLLRFLRDPAHRDALRSANGVNVEHERATSIAWAALSVLLLIVVLAVVATTD